MGTIIKRRRRDGSVAYRATVRVKRRGKVVYQATETFDRQSYAKEWVHREEGRLRSPGGLKREGYRTLTLGEVIRRYMETYGGGFGRTKYAHLDYLSRHELASEPIIGLTTERLVEHGETRRKEGSGPVGTGNDYIWLNIVFRYARSALGVPVEQTPVQDARTFLMAERLIRNARKRDRRPTADELEALDEYFRWKESKGHRISLPMRELMWFAIYSTRRQAEITRLLFSDNDPERLTGIVRDAKHPRHKDGNHRVFRYTPEAWEIVQRRPRDSERIFPYNPKTIGTYFTRACKILGIEDLRWHDFRHEGVSRLFEKGYSIPEVALHSLHDDWNELRRYTNLRPGDVKSRP